MAARFGNSWDSRWWADINFRNCGFGGSTSDDLRSPERYALLRVIPSPELAPALQMHAAQPAIHAANRDSVQLTANSDRPVSVSARTRPRDLLKMTDPSQPEVWLRGPLPDYPDELQPVAQSLLQVREEIEAVATLPSEHVWARPGGAASIGFHLRHLAGSLDRLLTYARGDSLNAAQRVALSEEVRDGSPEERAETLVQAACDAIDRALAQVRTTPICTLEEVRPVGRAGLPSTVLGLLSHAADHAQRHSAQIITTAKVVKGRSRPGESA
jgi:hypothetical protein